MQGSGKGLKRRSWVGKVLIVLMICIVGTSACLWPAAAYQIPAGVDKDLQPALQAKIQSGMDAIIKKIETDMTAAVDPLIPQINTMVTTRTKDMGPKINELGIAVIQPSLKAHVEEQTRLVGAEVNAIIMEIVGGDLRSDPTELIRARLTAELPRIKQETIERANQEQIKDMQTVEPQIEAIIQEELNALVPEIQNIIQVKLKETVPETQKSVHAEIENLITKLQQSLPDEQKELLAGMRPQFEAAARPQISEELFEAVAAKIDQRVADGLKKDTLDSIKSIVVPMNQYCTDFSTSYAKTLLPPQVDQMGIRSQIETLIDESAAANVKVFEDRIMAENEIMFNKQNAAMNELMHSFVKSQVMMLLEGNIEPAAASALSSPAVQPAATAPASSANVFVNGQQLSFDVPPIVIQGRTLVPLRAIFEALGAKVNWDQATHTISARKGDVYITLQPDSTAAVRNAEHLNLDVPATIVDGRTMVPARFVSESFGAVVNWDNNTRSVIIQSQ